MSALRLAGWLKLMGLWQVRLQQLRQVRFEQARVSRLRRVLFEPVRMPELRRVLFERVRVPELRPGRLQTGRLRLFWRGCWLWDSWRVVLLVDVAKLGGGRG